MKFVSWNVAGIRACIKKDFINTFNTLNADIFALQEIKAEQNQVTLNLDGYEQYWYSAEKKGYSGTAIFTKIKPLNVSYGMVRQEFDNEGRIITLEFNDYYFVTVYVPNSKRGLARLSYRMEWDNAFRQYIQDLDKQKPVIICGDFNVAHNEIDLKNYKSNHRNPGFTDEEREKFNELLNIGLTDTFRFFYPNKTDAYTFWVYYGNARTNNTGWRIDYFLVSNRFMNNVKDATIHNDIFGSDHCPISITL